MILPWWSRIALVAAVALGGPALAQERVSRFNEYRGYSEARFDGFQRTSQYLTMRDGVRLAIDILRPTKGGVVATEKLPVIWTHHRYHRGNVQGDTVLTILDWTAGLKDVLLHGYVVAAVDTRGGGASFGTQPGFFSREESRDAYEITEWLARQPWSTGKVGMFGRSYLGITQYFAAAERPPHLAAIFPEMAVFDFYSFIYPGGIYRDDFFRHWQYLTHTLDNSTPEDWYGRKLPAVLPVDGDSGVALRAAAIRDHQANRDIDSLWSSLPFRDSKDPLTGRRLHPERSPHTYLARINAARIPAYHVGGWFDAFPKDVTLWWANYRGPERLTIGPWQHGGYSGWDIGVERLRWYDYWLKGIQNGVTREAPIHYWTLNAPAGREWRSAWSWPLETERRTTFFFGPGKSGSIDSRNDGLLGPSRPAGSVGFDEQLADLSATVGTANRWTNTYGGKFGYPDLASNDRKGWTYTTEPLPEAIEVTGHPVAYLWVTADRPDADFFVYLEDVAPSGASSYLTEGTLKASRRALATPPFASFGLPYHPGRQADTLSLPNHPVELAIDLLPTSVIFQPGHRIRVTITGADRDNNVVIEPAPTVRVYRSTRYPSRIVLPVIPTQGGRPR